MTVTVTNLLQGPAELFQLDFADPDPATADADLSTARDLGGTDGGATLTVAQTYTPLTVDQVGMAVGARKTALNVAVATSLAEATLDNLRAALNEVAGVDPTEIELNADITNTEPNYTKIVLRGQAAGGLGKPRLVIVRRCLSTESIGMSWTKDGKTMIPVTFTGYYVSASIFPVKITDKLATP